jgi:hypothetical protein
MKSVKPMQREKKSTQIGAAGNTAVTLVIALLSAMLGAHSSFAAETWTSSDSDQNGWHIRTVIGSSTRLSTFYLTVAPILPEREYRNRTGSGTFRVRSSDSAQAFVAYYPGTVTVRAIYWPDVAILSRNYARQIQVNAMAVVVCPGFLNWNFGPVVTNLVPAVGTNSSAVSGCPGNQGTPIQISGFFSATARNL